MKKYLIAPSILSANFACLGEEVKSVITAGADIIHIDVMDNHYVPNLTIGPMVCKALRNYGIKSYLDVHLMVKPVDSLIVEFAKAGANSITFHPEASMHVDRSIRLAKNLGCRAGLALNPATPIQCLDYVLTNLDSVLLMTVNPGFGGQDFITEMIDKIRQVRKKLDSVENKVSLSVDGGIKTENISEIAAAGADVFVVGSAIFSKKNYREAINKLRIALS